MIILLRGDYNHRTKAYNHTYQLKSNDGLFHEEKGYYRDPEGTSLPEHHNQSQRC